MSWPSKTTRPAVGSTRRSRALPSVDLPHPDSPTTPSVSPADLEVAAVDGADIVDDPSSGAGRVHREPPVQVLPPPEHPAAHPGTTQNVARPWSGPPPRRGGTEG